MYRIIALLLLIGFNFSSFAQLKQGIDRILKPTILNMIKGKRVAILAHYASRDASNNHLVDLLWNSESANVVKIFAPEHGFRTLSDDWVGDSRDQQTGLMIYSLYKQDRRAPTQEQLSDVDMLIIDLKDVGMRFYTYQATMALTMKACKQAGVQVVVLDRLNPLGGKIVEGAALEASLAGWFVSYYPIATRHGMTMGELATLYNNSYQIGADLTVVKLEGWRRDMLWGDIGLKWIAPSPALPRYNNSYYYALTGLLEALDLAVGRSQNNRLAFKQFGAPWISQVQANELSDLLNGLNLSSVSFRPISWEVTRSTHLGKVVNGVSITVSNWKNIDVERVQIELLKALIKKFPTNISFNSFAKRLIGAQWLIKDLSDSVATDTIQEHMSNSRTSFMKQREQSLLYQ